MFPRLQYISQGQTPQEQLRNIQEVLDGGCTWIQLRFKNGSEDELLAVAARAREMCARYKSIFIVNDRPQVAKAVDADGVHLGLNDMAIADARKIVGSGKVIGGTANTFEDVWQRYTERCDYVGVGPFRFTATKEKLSPTLGLTGLRNIGDKLIQKKANIPVYAIGGIVPEDIASIMETGTYGVAISGALTSHRNKKEIINTINSVMYAKAYDSQ